MNISATMFLSLPKNLAEKKIVPLLYDLYVYLHNSISSSAEVVTELYERQYHACVNQLYHSWRQISHALFRAARNSWLIAKVVQEFCCFNLIKISINLLVIQICFSLLIIHELERFKRGKFILSAE